MSALLLLSSMVAAADDHGEAMTDRRNSTYILSNLDGVSAPSREQHSVADSDADGLDDALLVGRTGSDGDDSRLRQRRLGDRGREEDSARGFLRVNKDFSTCPGVLPTRDGDRAHSGMRMMRMTRHDTHSLGLESLNEDPVEEGLEGLDVLESSRGLGVSTSATFELGRWVGVFRK